MRDIYKQVILFVGCAVNTFVVDEAGSHSGVPRRRQEERSATTRQAINEATIRCLITLGYSGTTMSAVSDEAGVSRGAVTHQFPSKQEMMFSAIDHLASCVAAELRAASRAIHSSDDRATQVILLLWQSFVGDLFHAALELWVVARTDAALHEALVHSERQLGVRNRELLAEMFGPDIAASAGFDFALDTTFNLMRGVAVTGILRQDADRDLQLVNGWARIFTSIISMDAHGVEHVEPGQKEFPS